ncbi:MAG: 4Fe-4S binding protein [Eubacteriales bacterium]
MGLPLSDTVISDFAAPIEIKRFYSIFAFFLRPLAAKIATPVPKIRTGKCIGCGKCAESCPQHTIEIKHKKAYIIYDNCIRCYCCHEMCPEHIIDIKRLALFNL